MTNRAILATDNLGTVSQCFLKKLKKSVDIHNLQLAASEKFVIRFHA